MGSLSMSGFSMVGFFRDDLSMDGKVYVRAVYPWVVSLWMGGSSTASLTTRGQGPGEVL